MERPDIDRNRESIPEGVDPGVSPSHTSRVPAPAGRPDLVPRIQRALRVEAEHAGRRLDQALASCWSEFSRGRIQQWIEGGQVLVNGRACRSREKVWQNDEVRLDALLSPDVSDTPEAIPLQVVHEDDQILVIDKPPGLVVHPAAGNPDGTLLNALLHRVPGLASLPRAGIVHRLDKDTSGLLVVAKTLEAHHRLVEQLRCRTVHREYRALVQGDLVAGGAVDAPIGRHPTQRTRMAVVGSGRPALTHYRVLERYAGHCLLAVELETGRTHQIRVHLAHLHHPLVGDRVYGNRPRPPKGATPTLTAALQGFPRQALHAIRLGLVHPGSGAAMEWEVPMAEDLSILLDLFRAERPGEPRLGPDRA